MSTYNSEQYQWDDLSIAYGSRILEGITGLEYTEKQEKDYLYGRGAKPLKVVRGNKTFEGKIKIWQSELEAMIRDAPNNDVLSLKFNVTVANVPKSGGQTVIDILKDVEITEVPKGMNQGDKNQIIELPIIFLDIARQQ